MNTATQIISLLENYITALDWSYIMTFILICYGVNHYKVKEGIGKATGKQTRTRYRVVLIGIVYGAILYFIRGYTPPQIEMLLQSFIFALVFHKLIIEAIICWLAKQGLPESISKHLLDEDQLKKVNDKKTANDGE